MRARSASEHAALTTLAGFFIALWPVGVPLSFAVLLFYHRRNLKGLPAEAAIGPAEDHVGEKDAAAAGWTKSVADADDAIIDPVVLNNITWNARRNKTCFYEFSFCFFLVCSCFCPRNIEDSSGD